jgi:hypothetical protein
MVKNILIYDLLVGYLLSVYKRVGYINVILFFSIEPLTSNWFFVDAELRLSFPDTNVDSSSFSR